MPSGICEGPTYVARILATSADDAAHALIFINSIQRSFKNYPMSTSSGEDTTFSLDNDGGEEEVNEI